MMDSTDMSTPVTRGELQEVLSQVKQEHRRDLREATAPLATKAELHQEIQAAIAPLATKAELQAAIAPLATKAELQAAIAPLATKAELEMWGGALVARIEQGEQRLGNLERGQEQLIGLFYQTQQQIQQTEERFSDRLQQTEQRFSDRLLQTEERFSDHLQQTEQRLLAELARHTSAIHEAMRTEIKASFEPLADLPGRVSRLEATVFGPKPDRPTRRRKH
jgi:chromosome segregation ATPase